MEYEVVKFIVQVLGAFIAIYAFAIVLEVPRRLLFYSGITGMIGWFIYLISDLYIKKIVISALFSAMAVSLVSYIFSRRYKAPATIFLVAGILPMVPGGSIYRSVYYMILNDTLLSNYYFVETLQIAGAISLGIFLMESFLKRKTIIKYKNASNEI